MKTDIRYDINRPWLTLDPWQKKYIETPPKDDCFLLCSRQSGKTTGMSMKAVELCVKHFKKGDCILISSITEKQAYHMLAKALVYAKEKYPFKLVLKGKDKPTMHKINFRNGSSILCYAAGESGEGLRGFTIKKHMVDEGSRMSDEFFVATIPALSVCGGSLDIASTPCGKEGFFYECSKDKSFKKFYVSAEDCPRHTTEFLNKAKKRLTKLEYAQEFLAMFLDELKRVFSDKWISEVCVGKRRSYIIPNRTYLIGCDIAGWGGDKGTYEIFERVGDNLIQLDNIVEKGKLTTETTARIINLDSSYDFAKIAIDDGGLGFGVFSELMDDDRTKTKTIALNNSSRPIDKSGKKSKKLLKEEMYIHMRTLGELGNLKLLDDDEIKSSLRTIQHDTTIEEGKPSRTKIFGSDSHIVEGCVRGVWLGKSKNLNIWLSSIKI